MTLEMGSRDCDEVLISGNDKASCSDTTVEIKIKTLDSHTYTLRVDKYVSNIAPFVIEPT